MELQHRGIRDLGYMVLFGKNFSTPTFGPRQLCKCAKESIPLFSSDTQGLPPGGLCPNREWVDCDESQPAAVK